MYGGGVCSNWELAFASLLRFVHCEAKVDMQQSSSLISEYLTAVYGIEVAENIYCKR